MRKVTIQPFPYAYRLLNPGTVVLVSVGNGEQDNLFAVTWNMPVRKEPGKITILSGKRHYSYPFIEETGVFGINVPDASLVEAVYGCGTCSGRDVNDKFEKFDLTRRKPVRIKAPLVKEAVANLECRVSQMVDMGASTLIIADILTAVVDPQHFQHGQWNFDNGLQLLHHLGGNRFTISEKVILAKNIT